MSRYFIPSKLPIGVLPKDYITEKLGFKLEDIPYDRWEIELGVAGYTIVIKDDKDKYEPVKQVVKFGQSPRVLEL